MTQTLVIETNGAYQIRDVPMGYPETNDALLDGGFMQHMHTPAHTELGWVGNVVFIMDEEGQLKNLADNLVATALWYQLGGAALMPGDRFRGRVGVAGVHGENIVDVPDLINAITPCAQRFAVIPSP